jgi:hypothetical protein
MSRLTLLLLASASLLLGCPEPTPIPVPTPDGGVEPPPLATLKVQLSLDAGVTVSGDVRLALVWHPLPGGSDGGTPAPGDIASQELGAAGPLGQPFTVGFFEPPPETALSHPEGDPSGAFALGSVVAYEDLDHDGHLTVGSQGATTDRVLGSTSAGPGALNYLSPGYWVVWLRTGSELESPSTLGLRGVPGYNLVYFRDLVAPAELVPLDNTIPLELTAAPRLQLVLCPGAYVTGAEQACGAHVWDAPETVGSIVLNDNGSMYAGVMVKGPGAKVVVNGVEIPEGLWEDEYESFQLDEAAPSVLRVGVNDVVVQADGYEPVTLQVTVPARFEVTSPASGSTLHQGSALTATWTPAAGATAYSAGLTVGQLSDRKTVRGPQAALTVPAATGKGTLWISAVDVACWSRVNVVGASVRTVTYDVAP